jgi:hypothetical protein
MATGSETLEGVGRASTFEKTLRSRQLDHRFYLGMALVMAFGVFAGFTRTYYARSYFHSPAIPLWVHVHGAIFTGWMLFYILQCLLAMYGGMKLHRSLGIVGGLLASGVVIMGNAIAIRQARQGGSFPFPDSYSLLTISFGQMALFAVFIYLSLKMRRDGEAHKRFILMATQMFFFPAFGRLLHGISPVTLVLALCFYFAGPVYDRVTRGSVHRAYRLGVPLLILTMPPFGLFASHAALLRHALDYIIQ